VVIFSGKGNLTAIFYAAKRALLSACNWLRESCLFFVHAFIIGKEHDDKLLQDKLIIL